ncbi:Fatty acid desaturase 3, partial [Orchesella cincta]
YSCHHGTKHRDASQDHENLIQEENAMKIGKKEVLYDGYFYDVTNFIDKHPIQEEGRCHYELTSRRPAMEHEMNFGSDGKSRDRYKNMTKDFRQLLKEAEEEGLFKPVYFRNAMVVIEVTLTMLVGGYIVMQNDAFLWKVLGAIITGLGMGRMGLLQHECGHNSVTGNPKRDKFLQNIFYGFYMGMSSQWWVRRHNRHHAMPQRFQRDFDMEHLPVTAVHEDFVYDPENIAQNNVLTRNQGFLLPLNGTLFICAINFYYHPHYIFKRRLWNEMIALLLHFGIAFSTIGVWPYMLAKSFMSLYLSSSFALNHTHLPITYDPKHWLNLGFSTLLT